MEPCSVTKFIPSWKAFHPIQKENSRQPDSHFRLGLASQNAAAAGSRQQAAVAAVVTTHQLLPLQQQLNYTNIFYLISQKFRICQLMIITFIILMKLMDKTASTNS
jgi:hypothetical protein